MVIAYINFFLDQKIPGQPHLTCIKILVYYPPVLSAYVMTKYRGVVDSEGRPVIVVVGAYFLLRCFDLERFVLYVVREKISTLNYLVKK